MFGLAQAPSICLRCQLRSEIRRGSHFAVPRAAAPVQLRWQSGAPTVAKSEAVDKGSQEPHGHQSQEVQQGLPSPLNEPPIAEGPQPSGESHPSSGARPPRRKYNRPRAEYRFGVSPTSWKRVNVHQESVELGVNALGKPAQIRIVRDKPHTPDGARPKRRRKVAETSSGKGSGPRDFNEDEWVAALAGVGAEASEAAVNENIEQVRRVLLARGDPAAGFSRKHCVEVASQLLKGLSYDQLAAYARAKARPPITPDVHDLERWFRGRLVSRARWFGGESDMSATAATRIDRADWALLGSDAVVSAHAPPAQGADRANPRTKKLGGKHRLVERVLREIWAVREKGELSWGELDFRVSDPVHLELLMLHCTWELTVEARGR